METITLILLLWQDDTTTSTPWDDSAPWDDATPWE